MDPTQNQSDAPGPIFSAGASPEESPTPPAGDTSPASSPFSSGSGDIILQPSNSYSTKPRSKKPLIIVGIIAAVAVIALLILLPVFKNGSEANDSQNDELNMLSISINGSFKYATDLYDDCIGINTTEGTIYKNPKSILFGSKDTYDLIYGESVYALDLLKEIQDIAAKSHKYEQEVKFIVDNAQNSLEAIKKNSDTLRKLNETFIKPIQDSGNWQFGGCINPQEINERLNSSDKKLSSIASKYSQLTCSGNTIQISFEGDETSPYVDDITLGILNDISKSLSDYLVPVAIDSKEEVLDKLKLIIDNTKPNDIENTSNQNGDE